MKVHEVVANLNLLSLTLGAVIAGAEYGVATGCIVFFVGYALLPLMYEP